MNPPLYLVTGGCGFIGSHLVEALCAQGARVRILDDLSTGSRSYLANCRGEPEIRIGDAADPETLAEACRDVHGIFHLAALVSVAASVERPLDNHRINATGTLLVLEAARRAGVRRVIYASTAAVYGNDPTLPKHEDLPPAPASPYAAAKLASEYYLKLYASLYGLQTLSLRFFNVFGPRQDPRSPYSGVITRFLDAVRAGRPLTVFGDGRQSRDFVHVRDVVKALLAAMAPSAPSDGTVINVATGRATDLLFLIGLLEKLAGRRVQIDFAPPRVGDVRHSLADISRARQLLGYAPSISLEQGLEELWRTST